MQINSPTLFLMTFLLLTACGYQLRGVVQLPKGMENIYLENASGPLRDEIKKALKFSKGQLVATPQAAGVVIKISQEKMKTRVLSLSATGKANQFELIYSLIFSVYEPSGKLLLANQRVQNQRSYFNNQQEILAQTNEEQLIRNEMYNQAVRSIVIRTRIAMENSQKKSNHKINLEPTTPKTITD
jgi:LPS-assembly lipoprotein